MNNPIAILKIESIIKNFFSKKTTNPEDFSAEFFPIIEK